MIIIGVDFSKLLRWIPTPESSRKSGWRIAKTRKRSAVDWRARRCGLGWKPAGMLAGSKDSWPSYGLSCGIGDAAEIRAKRVRKQKTDRQDAQLILRLLVEDRFPQIWCQVVFEHTTACTQRRAPFRSR